MLKYILFSLLLVLFSAPTAPASQDLKTVLEKLEAYIPHALTHWGTPGCAVVIVKGDEIIYMKAFGEKHQGQGDVVDTKTVFPLASVSKNITALLLAQLVEEGRLSWNDPVKKYIPELELASSEFTDTLTILDIASHRSGLPNFSADSIGYLEWSRQEIIDNLKKIPFKSPPGKVYDYQNVMFGLLGLVIEKVLNKPLKDIYQERIFGPLGMKNASLGEVRPALTWWGKIKNLGRGSDNIHYEENLTGLHDHTYPLTQARTISHNTFLYTFPVSSGINASIEDMAQLLKCWLNDTRTNNTPLLKAETIAFLHQNHITVPMKENGGIQFPSSRVSHNSYGIGFFNHDYLGHSVWTQMGGMNGIRTLLSILPDEKIGIVILSNLGGMRVSFLPESIRHKFFDLLLKAKDDYDWAQEDSADMQRKQKKFYETRDENAIKDPSPMKSASVYEGTYRNALYGDILIKRQGNEITFQYKNFKPIPLKHTNGSLFSFHPETLTNCFPALDIGELMFGLQGNYAYALVINLMFEGIDRTFIRVPGS